MNTRLSLFFAIMLTTFFIGNAKVIYVNAKADTKVHDGTTWESAYSNLKTALVMAENGDQIWVAEGAYTPTLGSHRGATFLIMNDIELYGGFSGMESSISDRDPGSHLTILTGDLNGDDYMFAHTAENSFHVISIHGSKVLIDGCLIRGGNANGTKEKLENVGGGIDIREESKLILQNCAMEWNQAYQGGGIHVGPFATLTLRKSRLKANSATVGGAVFTMSQQPCLIEQTVFIGNKGGDILNPTPVLAGQPLVSELEPESESVDLPVLEATISLQKPPIDEPEEEIMRVSGFAPFNMYVYPNPFRGNLSLDFNRNLQSNATLELLNTKGKKIISKDIKAQAGMYQLAMEDELPTGSYQVVLTYENQTYIQVVNKW